jgi:hypothetical protein
MDHALEAKKLLDRADECRALARIMEDDEARASYLKLPDAYEALVRHEQSMMSFGPLIAV